MAQYLIHACQQRLWYVKEFLIPSMLKQGIPKENIRLYLDVNGIGNLRAFIDSCNKITATADKYDIDGVWHLQDDVCICKDFAERTEEWDVGLICGFTCDYRDYGGTVSPGSYYLRQERMWFSFPCIRIPSDILKKFTEWANIHLWQSKYFSGQVKHNRADDLVFREWLYDNYPGVVCHNIAPNLVNHIDDLISGSVTNPTRQMNTRAMFWEDDDIVEQLKLELDKRKNI